jgi:hypothetical protein
MITCPRCQQKIDSQALQCPYCSNILKAYGHPGMTLHQAVVKGEFLCQTCLYHIDDSCNFPQRPYATSCTLYRNNQTIVEKIPPLPLNRVIKNWCLRNKGLLLLLTIILGSVAIAFINSRR